MVELSPAGAAAEIVALINSRVSSPRQEELEAIIARVATQKAGNSFCGHSAHRAEWDAIVREDDEAQARASRIEEEGGSDQAIAAAEEFCGAVGDRLSECAKRIFGTPAQSQADILLLAEACFRTLWSGCNLNGPDADAQMAGGPHHEVGGIDDPCGEALAALLKGIRDLGGTKGREAIITKVAAVPTKSIAATPELAFSPALQLSPLHQQHRELIAAFDQCCRQEETPESEAQLDALIDQATALSDKIWQTPAVTPADVLLRAEVAMHHENGAMGCLDDPNAHYDDRAFAQLISAVLRVWGPAHA